MLVPEPGSESAAAADFSCYICQTTIQGWVAAQMLVDPFLEFRMRQKLYMSPVVCHPDVLTRAESLFPVKGLK
jgi:hypothetical protein